ncbi:class II fumarate hydratase [Candidatus Nitrospira salsa]
MPMSISSKNKSIKKQRVKRNESSSLERKASLTYAKSTLTRVERDSLGEIMVPAQVYYGAQTARAMQNFPISGLRFSRSFIRALGLIKQASAKINHSLGLLDRKLASTIRDAAEEVIQGKWDSEFPVDIFQTGSGTSTNMNINEVLASRASELLGGTRESHLVHPHDHVNLGQSSNDVIPSAIHIAAIEQIHRELLPALIRLQRSLLNKTRQFDKIVKIGRTHLQDATPIRLGQEFGGYARQIELGITRAKRAQEVLTELALGGTAVGTGLNTHPVFAKRVIREVSKTIRCPLRETVNHFEAQSAQDSLLEASGCLRTIAVSLLKVANDVRWMGSGPRCGLGEITLPETQPGSSMMPGKVNPVIAESVAMVAVQVMGNDATIAIAGQTGNFELNAMLPVMAYNLLQSIELLSTAAKNFSVRCIEGIVANKKTCERHIEDSLAMCTALAPMIGYEAAAAIAKESYRTGKTVREIARQRQVLSDKQLQKSLDSLSMTGPSTLVK